MTTRPKANFSVDGTMLSGSKTENRVRGFTYNIDEPTERHGTNSAPSPLEHLLGAYLGCTNVIAHIAANDLDFKIDGMEMRASAELDARAVYGQGEVKRPFPEVVLDVKIKTNESDERVEQLAAEVAKRCPVHVILEQAGCQMKVSWNRVN